MSAEPTAPKVDFKRRNQVKRIIAKAKSKASLSPEAKCLFDYLLILQGENGYAYPSQAQLGQFAGSRNRALGIIDELEKRLPREVFYVISHGKGRKRREYRCLPYELWPNELVQMFNDATVHNPEKRVILLDADSAAIEEYWVGNCSKMGHNECSKQDNKSGEANCSKMEHRNSSKMGHNTPFYCPKTDPLHGINESGVNTTGVYSSNKEDGDLDTGQEKECVCEAQHAPLSRPKAKTGGAGGDGAERRPPRCAQCRTEVTGKTAIPHGKELFCSFPCKDRFNNKPDLWAEVAPLPIGQQTASKAVNNGR